MSRNTGWTPGLNRDISYEEGLAMIDSFFDGPSHTDPSHTSSTSSKSSKRSNSAAHAQEADDARTAAAIAQLSHSPVAHPPKSRPILPSSPPREYQPQWQPHWTQSTSLAFTSSPLAVINPPPPTPIAGFPIAAGTAPFAVTSHINSMPSPLQSPAPSPNAVKSETDSPTLTSSKETSPVFSSSNTESPAPSFSMAGSPRNSSTPTVTPTQFLPPALHQTSVLTPTVPRTNIPPMPPATAPIVTPGTVPAVALKINKKENAPSSNKVAKKRASDSPSASTPKAATAVATTPATSRVKKSRCTRCVKQHGACDLDTKHPCERCEKAGLTATDCVPREYKPKGKP